MIHTRRNKRFIDTTPKEAEEGPALALGGKEAARAGLRGVA